MQIKNIEQFIIRQMITFRDFIFILSAIASWMTFAVLNRPPGTPPDSYSDGIKWANLVWSCLSSVFVIIAVIKYIPIPI